MSLISKKHHIFIHVVKFDTHLNVQKKVFTIPGNLGNFGLNYRCYKNYSSSQTKRPITLVAERFGEYNSNVPTTMTQWLDKEIKIYTFI